MSIMTKTGRKTKLTPEVVKKLEYILERDGTVTMACNYAGISRETYYNGLERDKEFHDKMTKAQDNTYVIALDAQNHLLKNKDGKAVESFLKRRDKRYKDKQEAEVDAEIVFKWAESNDDE